MLGRLCRTRSVTGGRSSCAGGGDAGVGIGVGVGLGVGVGVGGDGGEVQLGWAR